jgi:hypothetical protein
MKSWLARKISSGKLLTLPTYYRETGAPGHRPERYARKLLADFENPAESTRTRGWLQIEAELFRRWVESGSAPRSIHPVSGAVTARKTILPEGVTWIPPHAFPWPPPAPSIAYQHTPKSADPDSPTPPASHVRALPWPIFVLVLLCFAIAISAFEFTLAPPLRPDGTTMPTVLAILGAITFFLSLFAILLLNVLFLLIRIPRPTPRNPSANRPVPALPSGSRLMFDPWLDGCLEGES